MISKHANFNDERIAHLEAERLDLSHRVSELQTQVLVLTQDVHTPGGLSPEAQTATSEAASVQLRSQMSELCREMKKMVVQQDEQGMAVEGLNDLESRLVQHLEIARTDQQADHVRLREDVERFMAAGGNGGSGDWSTLQRKCDELSQAMEIHFSSLRQAEILQPLEIERQERGREIGELVEFVQSERQHRIQHVEELAIRQQHSEEELCRMVKTSIDRLREDLAAHTTRQAEHNGSAADAASERKLRTSEIDQLAASVQKLENRITPPSGRGGLAAIDDVKLELECGLQQHREQNKREFFQLQASVREQLGPDAAGELVALRRQLAAANDATQRLRLAVDAFQEGTEGSLAQVQAQVALVQKHMVESSVFEELKASLEVVSVQVASLEAGGTAAMASASALTASVEQLRQALQTESLERRTSIGDIHARIRQEVASLAAHVESRLQG